jgi:hypothetical protein
VDHLRGAAPWRYWSGAACWRGTFAPQGVGPSEVEAADSADHATGIRPSRSSSTERDKAGGGGPLRPYFADREAYCERVGAFFEEHL